MKREISFKIWLTIFFGGIWQLIRNIFSWKNKTPFWRAIWATITICVVAATAMLALALHRESLRNGYSYTEGYYDSGVSPIYKFCHNGHGSSYIYDARTKKKVMKGIDWVAVPESGDSLMVVAKDGKRGYVNRFTMKPVIDFKYNAAWSFYEGVAAVCENDSIYFIDHTGNPINDVKFPRAKNYDNYAYHGRFAAIPVGGRYGLIDKTGSWIYPPLYDYISIGRGNFWRVADNGKVGVIGPDGAMRVPCEYKGITINSGENITVTRYDNVQQLLDYDGNLLEDFVFDEVYFLSYYLDEMDKDGNQKQGVADMLKYRSGLYYGLMSRSGIPITKPLYSDINCVVPGVYQCELPETDECVIIDSKGNRVTDKRYQL